MVTVPCCGPLGGLEPRSAPAVALLVALRPARRRGSPSALFRVMPPPAGDAAAFSTVSDSPSRVTAARPLWTVRARGGGRMHSGRGSEP